MCLSLTSVFLLGWVRLTLLSFYAGHIFLNMYSWKSPILFKAQLLVFSKIWNSYSLDEVYIIFKYFECRTLWTAIPCYSLYNLKLEEDPWPLPPWPPSVLNHPLSPSELSATPAPLNPGLLKALLSTVHTALLNLGTQFNVGTHIKNVKHVINILVHFLVSICCTHLNAQCKIPWPLHSVFSSVS